MNLPRRLTLVLLLGAFFGAAVLPAADRTPHLTLGLIGDSTVCDYPATSPKRGWGQLLPGFLAPGAVVLNEARGGLSSKSFPADRWQRLLAAKPDFVLIQFGHNDMKKSDPARYTAPETGYRENLRRFAAEARAVGATPVFVTPVRRRTFKAGRPTRELAPYAEAMKAEAAALGVAVIDLHERSGELYARLGEAGSAAFTVNKVDQEDRPGLGDLTHFTPAGAREMARLVAQSLARTDARLGAWVLPAADAADGTAAAPKPGTQP